jgi:hypothetical protein
MNNINISVPGVIIGNIPAVALLSLFGNRHLALGYAAGVIGVLLGFYIKRAIFERAQ